MPHPNVHLLGTAVAILEPLGKHIEPHAKGLGRRATPRARHQSAALTLLGFLEDFLLDPSGQVGHVVIDCAQHRGMLLHPHHVRRRVLHVSRGQFRKVTASLLLGPALKGLDRHVTDAQGRQDA